jgi:hypothetical protein
MARRVGQIIARGDADGSFGFEHWGFSASFDRRIAGIEEA